MTAAKGSTNNTILKIVHEVYREKDKDKLMEKLSGEFNSAIENNPDIKSALMNNVSHILTPIDVLKLFQRIPESDIPLLAMDSEKYTNF